MEKRVIMSKYYKIQREGLTTDPSFQMLSWIARLILFSMGNFMQISAGNIVVFTYSDLRNKTGIQSDTSIRKGLDELIQYNWIEPMPWNLKNNQSSYKLTRGIWIGAIESEYPYIIADADEITTIMNDRSLGKITRLVYYALSQCITTVNGSHCYCTYKDLRDITCLSLSSVQKGLKKLQKKGIIEPQKSQSHYIIQTGLYNGRREGKMYQLIPGGLSKKKRKSTADKYPKSVKTPEAIPPPKSRVPHKEPYPSIKNTIRILHEKTRKTHVVNSVNQPPNTPFNTIPPKSMNRLISHYGEHAVTQKITALNTQYDLSKQQIQNAAGLLTQALAENYTCTNIKIEASKRAEEAAKKNQGIQKNMLKNDQEIAAQLHLLNGTDTQIDPTKSAIDIINQYREIGIRKIETTDAMKTAIISPHEVPPIPTRNSCREKMSKGFLEEMNQTYGQKIVDEKINCLDIQYKNGHRMMIPEALLRYAIKHNIQVDIKKKEKVANQKSRSKKQKEYDEKYRIDDKKWRDRINIDDGTKENVTGTSRSMKTPNAIDAINGYRKNEGLVKHKKNKIELKSEAMAFNQLKNKPSINKTPSTKIYEIYVNQEEASTEEYDQYAATG